MIDNMYIYKLIFLYIFAVTTLVVVWIEMQFKRRRMNDRNVTTLVVVWIEIPMPPAQGEPHKRHHSRSGVD